MFEEDDEVSFPDDTATTGYTYFGQFLDHDLTKDRSSLEEAEKTEPQELPNQQTPQLDLSHLYGGGPNGSERLYDGGIYLKVGPASKKTKRSFDIAIDPDITAQEPLLVGDGRSAENGILRQMVAAFARFHNFAVNHCDPSLLRLPSFERAKRQMIWQFQWLVVEDYLKRILNGDVYKKVFENRNPTFEWDAKEGVQFSIPVEFSVAAMRFGHSVVRAHYQLSDELVDGISLGLLFGHEKDRQQLDDSFEINWGFFFQGAGVGADGDMLQAVSSRPIDTGITKPLHKLPPDLKRFFNPAPTRRDFFADPDPLPVRTLLRGRALNLPSGQTVADGFGVPRLTSAQLLNRDSSTGKPSPQGEVLEKAAWLEETPLWYYLLRESELKETENGNRLGATGSHVVAETIYAALKSECSSFWKPGWKPPIWRGLPGGDRPLTDLTDFFGVASSIQPPYR